MDNVEVEMIDLFHFLISKGIEQKKESFMAVLLSAATKFQKRYTPLEIIKKVRY